MDWVKFKKLLEHKINLNISLKSPDEIETAVYNLSSQIKKLAWSSSSASLKPIPIPIPFHYQPLPVI